MEKKKKVVKVQNESSLEFILHKELLDLTSTEQPDDNRTFVEIKTKLVRVQYPGIVKCLPRALETLGGLSNIEMAVGDCKTLHVNFHPGNKFSKKCSSEKDHRPGLLLKVKVQRDPSRNEPKVDYEIVGVSVINFKFTKLYDFQYLPLIAAYPETSNSTTFSVHDDILPRTLPSLDWLKKPETINMPLFFPPISYGRFDQAKNKLQQQQNEMEKAQSEMEVPKVRSTRTERSKSKINVPQFGRDYSRKASVFHSFTEVEVPQKPTKEMLDTIKTKGLKDLLMKLLMHFENRPIWSKAGLMYNMKVTSDMLKTLLPCAAYYSLTGPWRSMWIRYGYDPRRDPKARIYQNLDYRVRTPAGSESIILAKRNSTNIPTSAGSKVSLGGVNPKKTKAIAEERSFILRPHVIPPARQMMYQFCDLHLPEVQKLLAQLSQPLPTMKCDSKFGWLHYSLIEQIRKIVNNYILEEVQSIIMVEKMSKKNNESPPEIEEVKIKSSDYCSIMLKNIKRGMYKKSLTEMPSTSSRRSASQDMDDVSDEDVTEIVDSDDEILQTNAIVKSLPERLQESDDESLDIDMDALEDVKNILKSSDKSKRRSNE